MNALSSDALREVLESVFVDHPHIKQRVFERLSSGTGHRLAARRFFSGYDRADDCYNSISTASDGNIYYVLSNSKSVDLGAQLYRYNPRTDAITHLSDINAAAGEAGAKSIPQGKSHSFFFEYDNKLFFTTHIGYYNVIDSVDRYPVPPAGYTQYPGGHLMAYDLSTGKVETFGIPVKSEGTLAYTMDTVRGRAYGITWPSGHFWTYDVPTRTAKDFGKISHDGEAGVAGSTWRVLCRAIAVHPDDGTVYFTNSDGDILTYSYEKHQLTGPMPNVDMRRHYFGQYDPAQPGHFGYHWRQILWVPRERAFYGTHGNSGYLFRFDPKAESLVVLNRLTSLPSQRAGVADQFTYGYLGLALGPDGRTVYHLTGAPVYKDGKRVLGKTTSGKGEAKGIEHMHLITYDIPTDKYIDHGPVFYEDGSIPTYFNSLAIGPSGEAFCLARTGILAADGHNRSDLVRIPPVSLA